MAPPPAAPRLKSDPLKVIVVPAPLGISDVRRAVMATPSTPIISADAVIRTIAPVVSTRPDKARAISMAVAP